MIEEEIKMRIAICDDEKIWINQIAKYLSNIKNVYTKIEYDEFSSGKEFLSYYTSADKSYDIMILDIEMDELSGIDVANIIRKKDDSVIIFFLTSHREYVYDCFRASPMNFWVKPVSEKVFREDIERAYNKINAPEKYLKIIENRKKVRIKCSSIIYLENVDRKICIYTTDGVYKVNKLISDFVRELDNNIFVRVYKSFIINLSFVHIIRATELELYGSNKVIPISRTYKAELMDKYIKFKEKECL